MSIFPIIKCLDDLQQKVSHLDEIRFSQQPNGSIVVCYMISDDDTFGGDDAYWKRECRGITFNKNGDIISRPLHKFFNMGERKDTQPDNLNWEDIAVQMEKRDGSMVHPVIIKNKLLMKSKKSFASYVALTADAHLNNNRSLWHYCYDMLMNGYTPIFELTSPYHRIVINYGDATEIRLLHVRNTITGEYLTRDEIKKTIKHNDIKLVDVIDIMDKQELLSNVQNITGIEGFVLQFKNGEMIKIKTKWYNELHHIVTFPTERSIAEMILSETIDDVKSYYYQMNIPLDKINKIEHEIVKDINDISNEVEYQYNKTKDLPSRKEFAIYNKEFKYFQLLMLRYCGKEIDYKEFYKKNLLKDKYQLIQLGDEHA